MDGPGVAEPFAALVGDVIASESIADRLASRKPPAGTVLVAPPSLLSVKEKSDCAPEQGEDGR